MKKPKKTGGGFKKYIAALVITGLISLVVISLHLGGALSFLEYKTYDFRVNMLARYSRPSDDIIVILLDQNSIDWANRTRGWGWPWPRKAFAEIVDYMNLGGANSIAFDVIFSEPSVYRNARQDAIIDEAVASLENVQPADEPRAGTGVQNRGRFLAFREIINALRTLSSREDDASFTRAEKDFGRVVQTVVFSSQTGNTDSWPADLDTPLFEPQNFESIISEYEKLNQDAGGGPIKAQFPIKELRNAAGVIGNVTGWPDSDGIFRRANLFSVFDGKAVPGLSAASLLAAGYDRQITYNEKKSFIEWDGWTIPVDRHGRSILRFRGDVDRYIPYFAHEILMSKEAYENGNTEELGSAYLPPEDFAGKFVFFGYYAQGLFDFASSPIRSTYPGVGMHITMLDNILQRDFIRSPSTLFDIILIFAAAALVTALTIFSNRIPVVVGGLVIVVIALTGFAFGAYHFGSLWVPLTAPLAGALLAFFTATLYNYATEGSQRRFIKSAFSQYLSPVVIDQLVANPNLLNLGGVRREISIFFSDVQGFTTISEKFKDDPPKLTELLNDYLSFMTDTILDSGGTIDKYEGDAIIAFWNAPLSYEDHAARAVQASLACQQRLAERQDFFEEKFGVRLLTRIGLNTGYAVVGNMGSSKRFDYTMLGDAVNLAARLEGLNKQFGTYLMCTGETFRQAGETVKTAGTGSGFFGRKLAQVAVVGKKEAVTVYEPLPEAVFRGKDAVIRRFDKARDLFYAGRFAEALPYFESLAKLDSPASFYAEQCRYYIERPAEWKGYWESKSK
ncbi:MAG: adenylate/guanylate cyclase domain-containing protein [Treponema sp.]|jgi:adenylate cyclase|nr:adenylate/guanylate cyclase domain-containing protein [Treponema sp.]